MESLIWDLKVTRNKGGSARGPGGVLEIELILLVHKEMFSRNILKIDIIYIGLKMIYHSRTQEEFQSVLGHQLSFVL